MPKLKDFAIRWGPPVVWMAVLFFASATPASDIPTFGLWDFIVKKGGHMMGYAVLGILFRRALGWERPVAAAWLPAVMYALLDESHQMLVPGRHPSIEDALGFDAVGAALGLFFSWLVLRGKRTRDSVIARS